MIKQLRLIPVLFFTIISCTTSDNNFSQEANVFLDAINGKNYTGENTFANSSFEANGTIIAEYRNDGGTTTALRFINTRNNGASKTEAIYQQRSDGQYLGVVIENSGNTLKRTAATGDQNSIAWGTEQVFAKR